MANVMTNAMKRHVLETWGASADIYCANFNTPTAGYDDPDVEFMTEFLALVTVPAGDERVQVGALTYADTATSEAGNLAGAITPQVTFAPDSGEVTEGVVFYVLVTNDTDSIVLSVHDHASKSLTTGGTVDPIVHAWELT